MDKRWLWMSLLALWTLLAARPAAAQAPEPVPADDVYVAGGDVVLPGEVAGDAVAAGRRVSVGPLVRGDAILAGGSVVIGGQVLDDVRAAGGEVLVNGPVGDDLIAAGGRVRLAPGARVGGRAWLAGGEVEVAGDAGRELRAAAGRVRLGGRVQGNVELAAEEVEILSTARIAGNLIYRSARPARIAPGAQIAGRITHIRTEPSETALRTGVVASGIVFIVGLALAGSVLFLLLPGITLSAARTIGSDPWRSLALGFALLVSIPFLAVLLMVTVIGIPLGLVLLALYPVMLLLGFLAAAFFLGDAGLRRLRRPPSKGLQLGAFIGALVLLALLSQVPGVGGLVAFLALLFGLGAWGLRLYRALDPPRAGSGAGDVLQP